MGQRADLQLSRDAVLGIVSGGYGAGRIVLESRDKQDPVSRINLAQAISTGFVTISLVAFAIAGGGRPLEPH